MKNIVTVAFCLCCVPIVAQLNLSKSHVFSANGSQAVTNISSGSGNIYYAMNYSDNTGDLDPTANIDNIVSQGDNDAALVCYNDTFGYKWKATMAGEGEQQVTQMRADNAGNVYMAGISNNIFLLGNNGANNIPFLDVETKAWDAVFTKYNASGKLQYAFCMGNKSEYESIHSILPCADGSVIVSGMFTGFFNSKFDVDPSADTLFLIARQKNNNFFMAKYNALGKIQWAKQINAQEINNTKLFATGTQGFGIVGNYMGGIEYNTGIITAQSTQNTSTPFISFFDKDGKMLWHKQFEIAEGIDMSANGISSDGAGNYYLAFSFNGQIDVDISTGINTLKTENDDNGNDIVLAYYDSEFGLKWAKQLTGKGNGHVEEITCDKSGNVFIAGGFTMQMGLDNNNTIKSWNDEDEEIFMATYTPLGVFRDGFALSGNRDESVIKLCVNENDKIIVAGMFGDSLKLNEKGAIVSTNQGTNTNSSFLALYTTCSELYTQQKTVCNNTYQMGTEVLAVPGTYTLRYLKAKHCDSVVQLTLSKTDFDKTVSRTGGCVLKVNDTAVQKWQWIHCETKTKINGAIGAVYNATANGNYACIVNKGTCYDTTGCITVTSVGVDDLQAPEISIYPNPAKEMLYVGYAENNYQIKIYNQMGSEVFTATNPQEINISGLKNGLYILSLSSAKGNYTKTFFKE